MKLTLADTALEVSFFCRIEDAWVPVPESAYTAGGFSWCIGHALYRASFAPAPDAPDSLEYSMYLNSQTPSQLRMRISVPGRENYFHVIPCNIYGDNHAAEAKPGEFPLLTNDHKGMSFCAPLWEFRADRAAMPLSALCWDGGVAAAAIEPYTDSD